VWSTRNVTLARRLLFHFDPCETQFSRSQPVVPNPPVQQEMLNDEGRVVSHGGSNEQDPMSGVQRRGVHRKRHV
jgi:hypothetical protein